MDFLASPKDQSRLGKTPYVAGESEKWDGGQFLHYACRRGQLGFVPFRLRRCSCAAPDLELLQPINKEKEVLFQTWFFFGLLAEFFDLNDEPNDATHNLVAGSNPSLDDDIKKLYETFLDGGNLSGTNVLEFKGDQMLLAHLHKYSLEDRAKRSEHLHSCLGFIFHMLSHISISEAPMSLSISMSIAGLGEYLNTTLRNMGLPDTGNHRRPSHRSGAWGRNYLESKSEEEEYMISRNWCKSDVEYVRQQFQGLSTRYFLSHLEKPGMASHGGKTCSFQRCGAAQLDPDNYKLSHAEGCDGCEEIGVDDDAVNGILMTTETFPILRLECSSSGQVQQIHVEEYDDSDEERSYVAISHVWADGMGNPKANKIQTCQIQHLGRLLQRLPARTAESRPKPDQEGGGWGYRLWIDTLCCPISVIEKNRALERIATVYREATCVVVLDKAISSYNSRGDGPAQVAKNCLRIVASSTWMRRLWTLQEGALAKFLLFAFKDNLVSLFEESQQLLRAGLKDARYYRIWEDVHLEVARLSLLCADKAVMRDQGHAKQVHQLWQLQCALYFRSVSKSRDEAVCIATLLSMDSQAILNVRCRQERMAILWEFIAQRCGGIPSRVIFFVDQPLDLATLAGWRWAPKSLLLPERPSGLHYDRAANRWNPTFSFEKGDPACERGKVTAYGLKVRYSGLRITLKPYIEGGPRWPWSPYYRRSIETGLYCRHKETGQWFKMLNYFKSALRVSSMLDWKSWNEQTLAEDKNEHREGKRRSQPLFNELCSGQLALINPNEEHIEFPYLLVRLQSKYVENTAVHVHSCLPVLFEEMQPGSWSFLDKLKDVAIKVSNSKENQDLLDLWKAGDRVNPENDEWRPIMRNLMKKMQSETQVIWDSDMASALRTYFGEVSKEDCWKVLLSAVPYDLSVESLSDGKVVEWIVDGSVAGDGLCKEECCNNIA